MKYIIIPQDPRQPIKVEETERLNLEQLQAAVGGHIERVHAGRKNLDLWINEDGKANDDLGLNERATMIAHHSQSIFPADYIVGDVVAAHCVEDFTLDSEQVDWLTSLDETFRSIRGLS